MGRGGRRSPVTGSGQRSNPGTTHCNRSAAVDFKDIKSIVDLMKKNSLSEFEMENEGFKIKLRRAASDDEIADAISFRCSPKGAYIHGQSINVCGGMVMW